MSPLEKLKGVVTSLGYHHLTPHHIINILVGTKRASAVEDLKNKNVKTINHVNGTNNLAKQD